MDISNEDYQRKTFIDILLNLSENLELSNNPTARSKMFLDLE